MGVPVTRRPVSGSESKRKRLFFHGERGRKRTNRLFGGVRRTTGRRERSVLRGKAAVMVSQFPREADKGPGSTFHAHPGAGTGGVRGRQAGVRADWRPCRTRRVSPGELGGGGAGSPSRSGPGSQGSLGPFATKPLVLPETRVSAALCAEQHLPDSGALSRVRYFFFAVF